MTDLESIRKRHEALTAPHGQAHARAVMKRTAPDDIAYLLAENARLATALATAKDEERAAVVAYLRSTAPYHWPCSPEPEVCADAIESNRHRGRA